MLLILFSFLSASAAEYSCLCSADVVTHSSEKAPSHESQSQSHCQHICQFCHLAVVVPAHFILKTESQEIHVTFTSFVDEPRQISQTLYRPPIV